MSKKSFLRGTASELSSQKMSPMWILWFFAIFLACFAFMLFNGSHKAYASSWTASAGFSTTTQGANQWYYQYSTIGGTTFTNMSYFRSGAWRQDNVVDEPFISISVFHPSNTYNAVRTWVAPTTGTISITGRAYKADTGGGNGVIVSVLKNTTSLWSQTIAYNDSTGYTTDAALSSVPVTAGDSIRFVVNNNGNYTYDSTSWDPTITYAGSSWTASADFSGTQGLNQWSYMQRTAGGGPDAAFTNMPNYSSPLWWGGTVGGSYAQLGAGSSHPSNGNDAVLKWVAPATGAISITGRAYKQDTGGGNGVVVSVQHNSTPIWKRTIAYNDTTGYTTDAALSSVYVTAGDAIYFISNNNGEWTYDQIGWNPTITYVTGTAPTWNLNSADTNLTLTISGNAPAISVLKNPTQNWNWTPTTTILPLMSKVYVGGTVRYPNWSYTGATTSSADGYKVTLTFTSTTPGLTLTQVWWSHTGPGPVELYQTITNTSGGDVYFNNADSVAANLAVTANSTVTLNRFDRASVNPNNTGIYKDVMNASTFVPSTVSNDWPTGPYVLPFIMLDVGGNHGLYMGYTWDFGKFNIAATASNALTINNYFALGEAGDGLSVLEGNTGVYTIPGMFFGTYQGDTDSGSNKMKKWFWNYRITPTLRNNTNEPLVEYGLDLYTEADINSFLTTNPLASWGVELLKEDAWWTLDWDTDPNFGWGWDYDNRAGEWPSGFTLGTIAHNTCSGTNCLKLSLYMGNRYQHNDLSTPTGVANEKAALLTRYDNWHYDYWRTDFEFESPFNYTSHQGFMNVVNYMIANRPNFRWENCSAGGSKKSFDLMGLMTFMTTEDSGDADNYRRAFYSNSFMIPPVQMKGDDGPAATDLQSVNYFFRSDMMGAWMNVSSGYTTFQNASYQTHIGLYKTKQRPIIRGGDTYHILPMPDGYHWDGMEFFNPDINKGSVFLFHPNAAEAASKTIFFKGLNDATTYTLTFQDRPAQNTSKTGLYLRTTGLTVTGLTGDRASEIIWIN